MAASAADDAWDPPITIADSGVHSDDLQLVTDGTTITAVWQGYDGSKYRLHTSSSTDQGATWGAPIILSEPGHNAFAPQLVTDGTTITIAWYGDDGSSDRVYTAHSTDGGTTWSTPFILSSAGQNARGPRLATHGTTITITWYENDASTFRIHASSSTNGGATWSAPVVLSVAGQTAYSPQIVADGPAITVAWSSTDGSDFQIRASSSSDGGTSWSMPTTLSNPSHIAWGPRLVTDGNVITVTWHESDGSDSLILTASSADGGTTWSAPTTLSNPSHIARGARQVTDGSVITVTWYEGDGSNYRINTSSSTDGGTTWSAPVMVSEAGLNAQDPQLVTDGTTITITWYEYDGSNYRVNTSSSTDGGTTWSIPLVLSASGESATGPQVVTDGTTITIAWYGYSGGIGGTRVSSFTAAAATEEPGVSEPVDAELAATGPGETLGFGAVAAALLVAVGLALVSASRRVPVPANG